jgi:hypothetical protein
MLESEVTGSPPATQSTTSTTESTTTDTNQNEGKQEVENNNNINKEEEEKQKKEEEELKKKKGFTDKRPSHDTSQLNLLTCLYSFTDPEILDGKNAYQCLTCTKKRLVNFFGDDVILRIFYFSLFSNGMD